MALNHTPGPWNIASVENSTGRIKHLVPIDGKCLSLLTVVENDQAVFAAVYNDSDARLIAAAPDLLEALQFVMTAHGEQLTTAFEQAQKAIAKATGEAA